MISSEYQLLEAFVGVWNTEGIIRDNSDGKEQLITGTDSYEWFPGGYFLIHKVDVKIGDERKEGLEVIGYDPETKTYPMHYFDSKGESGKMTASFSKGVWQFLSDGLRFKGGFTENGKVLSGVWEIFVDSKWNSFMEIKLTKANNIV
jgi:hypothetical protein